MESVSNHLRKIAGKGDKLVQLGKYLAFLLRHDRKKWSDPGSIGLKMDKHGWVNIDELIRKSEKPLTRELVEEIVRTNNKKRYRISDDGERIRASQGHSFEVDLGLEPVEPPEYLYHGTATRFLDSIMKKGIEKRGRQDVHLSKDEETAVKVGKRHGTPVVLRIEAGKMHKKGYKCKLGDDQAWLTDGIPLEFIQPI